MSPQLMLILCYGFIAWLFRKDMNWRQAGARALLVPAIWIAIQGSRPVSYWFGGGGSDDSNPINTLVYAALIFSAVFILSKRNFHWNTFVRENKILCLIYFYLALSALWSEMPLLSLKRLVKDFGTVLVALVFLTQADPAAAIRTIFVRVSYLLFPLSVVFIKFFPDIGRSFSRAGEAMFGGVTTQKNSLGEIIVVFGLMLLWDLVEIGRAAARKGKTLQVLIRLGMLLMGLWLVVTCDSQTSLLCLILGSIIFWGAHRLARMKQGKPILIAGIVAILCLAALDQTFGLSDMVIRALGRNPTLTGRTDIWRIVLQQQTDPLLGNGFYTFWDSSKGKAVMASFMKINETHNGYLEMYVDGGLVGDILLVLLLLVALGRVINRMFTESDLGKIGLVFVAIAVIYNFSETSFFRLDTLWFTLLLLTIEYPRESPPAAAPEEMERGNFAAAES